MPTGKHTCRFFHFPESFSDALNTKVNVPSCLSVAGSCFSLLSSSLHMFDPAVVDEATAGNGGGGALAELPNKMD